MWISMAILSAVLAGLTSIFAKCGIKKTDSDVAMAIRTVVVVAFAWLMVFIVGSFQSIVSISVKSFVFLMLSGIATGASWICYFKALSMGDINKVVPIDKSSTIITVILAIILFNESNNIEIRLISTALLATGIFMMVEKKEVRRKVSGNRWFIYAILSAIFAAMTSILAKYGISNVESNLATAIRTCFVLIMAWIIIFAEKKQAQVKHIDRRELFFIVLSGLATGGSWLSYYYAIQKGDLSVVVPIDKLSILVSIAFSFVVFKEKLSKKAGIGLLLMVVGTLFMALMS